MLHLEKILAASSCKREVRSIDLQLHRGKASGFIWMPIRFMGIFTDGTEGTVSSLTPLSNVVAGEARHNHMFA